VLAVCANAHSGIEHDIVKSLGHDLRLAGLTYARLHGKAVILLLGHQPGRRWGQHDNLRRDLEENHAGARLQVLVDEWQSRKQLGSAGPEHVLRVHIRAQDRPGVMLDVLDSLHDTLKEDDVRIPANNWNVWHARTLVTDGNTGFVRLTIRVSVGPKQVSGGQKELEFDDVARRVRVLTARKAAANSVARPSGNEITDGLAAPQDTVISISPIKVTEPSA
jgi:hypothetical protein